MSIPAIASHAYVPTMSPERTEGPDRGLDGDADDAGAAPANIQAPPRPGTGTVLDTQA